MNTIKRIGVLTSGGDAPGMNAAVRAVVRTALSYGIECIGIRRGWQGLITSDFVRLTSESVGHILCHTINHWLSCEIQSLDLIAERFRSGLNSCGEHQSRMEAFALYGETILQCQLLLHNTYVSIFVF